MKHTDRSRSPPQSHDDDVHHTYITHNSSRMSGGGRHHEQSRSTNRSVSPSLNRSTLAHIREEQELKLAHRYTENSMSHNNIDEGLDEGVPTFLDYQDELTEFKVSA